MNAKAQQTRTGHAHPQASEHANGEAAQVPGSAFFVGKGMALWGNLGKGELFSHLLLVWLDRGPSLFAVMYVCQGEHS